MKEVALTLALGEGKGLAGFPPYHLVSYLRVVVLIPWVASRIWTNSIYITGTVLEKVSQVPHDIY
jgi:hypothetical protein